MEIQNLLDYNFDKIVSILIVLFGVIVVTYSLYILRKSKLAFEWIKIKGEIFQSGVEKFKKRDSNISTYRADIRYRYEIQDEIIENDMIYFGSAISTSNKESKSKELSRKYYLGKEVTVYVNPKEKKESILEPGVHGEISIILGIGLIILLFGISIYFEFINLGL